GIVHENLVRVFDTSEFWVDGRPRYLLMELLDGITLEQHAREHHPLTTDQVFRFARDLTNALSALHDAGVVHRDVKPANVMITSDGDAVLLDLGVVRTDDDETITASQSFLGTLRYAA